MARPGRLLLICIAAASAACATTGATPAPFPRPSAPGPRPAAPTPAPAPAPTGSTPTPAPSGRTSNTSSPAATSAIGYGVAGTALSLRGAPYRNGGNDPVGFDCSGFVKYVFNQNGVAVPRTVSGQFHAGRHVNTPQLEPGDLVFFSTVSPGASHVGIAIGGDEFVHAPSRSGEVRVERMSASYWSTRFVGARRVL